MKPIQSVSISRGYIPTIQDKCVLQDKSQLAQKPSQAQPGSSRTFKGLMTFLLPLLGLTLGYFGVVQPLQREKKLQAFDKAKVAMQEQVKHKLDPELLKVRWSPNTKVYAATMQYEEAYWNKSAQASVYTQQLLQQLQRPDCGSIDEAHRRLEAGVAISPQWVYKDDLIGLVLGEKQSATKPQIPLSSTHGPLGWQKQETKPRFVLILQGADTPGKTDFEKGFDALKTVLHEQFEVPHNQMGRIQLDSAQSLENGVLWLKQCLEALPPEQAKEAEVLVYVAAHGVVDPTRGKRSNLPSQYRDLQGAEMGLLALDPVGDMSGKQGKVLSENTFKQMFAHYLSEYPITFIFDCCSSGSWIADVHPQQPTDTQNT